MIKSLPWVLFVLALAATLYLFFLLLDAGVALDNSRSQTQFLRERSNLALSIIRKDWIGRDVSRLAALSKEIEKQGAIVKTEGDDGFAIGDLIFETQDGVVVEVRYID